MCTNCEAFIVFIIIPFLNHEPVGEEEKCKIYGCLKFCLWMEAVEISGFQNFIY